MSPVAVHGYRFTVHSYRLTVIGSPRQGVVDQNIKARGSKLEAVSNQQRATTLAHLNNRERLTVN